MSVSVGIIVLLIGMNIGVVVGFMLAALLTANEPDRGEIGRSIWEG